MHSAVQHDMDEDLAKLRTEAEKLCRKSKQLIAEFIKLAERSQELRVPTEQKQPKPVDPN